MTLCSKDDFIHQEKHYAGYVSIKRGKLFYYHIPHMNNNLIIWLNGGPGCSSEIGRILENGPKIILENGKQRENEYSWDKLGNMLYIDQPLNVGFSEGESVYDEKQVVEDFTEFMGNLFIEYPQFQDMNIYLSGESFAGTYIPYIGQGLLAANFNVKGMLIGNGWIDPMHQYRSYIDYSIKEQLLLPKYIKEIESKWEICKAELLKSNKILEPKCEAIADLIFKSSKEMNQGKCTNMYDIRLVEEQGCGENWPYALPEVYKYLQNPITMAKLHTNKTWVECNNKVYKEMSKDVSSPSYMLLPDLLKKIPIILFNGDKDFICNHLGQESMINNMTWNNQKGFATKPKPVVLNGHHYGEIQSESNLLYLKIYNASHMVPIDQPEISYHMVKHFLEGTLVLYFNIDESYFTFNLK